MQALAVASACCSRSGGLGTDSSPRSGAFQTAVAIVGGLETAAPCKSLAASAPAQDGILIRASCAPGKPRRPSPEPMAVQFRDYYETLGVSKTASDDEI